MAKGSAVCDYFAAPANSFWQWQDEGNVIAWADGATIAFRYELRTILERLRTQSLPPLGALALLLAACRDHWNEPTSRLGLLQAMLVNNNRPDRTEFLARVMSRLDRISQLPGDLRYDSGAKAELAAMVFEGQGDVAAPRTYERLLEALANGLEERYLTPWPKLRAVDALLRDLAWLDRGLDRVDEQALRMRVRTGLDQSLSPVDVEVPAVGSARSLIAELKDDEELGGVARLAELLLAAVHLPTPVSEPEELPLGGVTDISNRGSLDRLLLSELAHDDLTLAVRVAMNEALYLRRETPPRMPTRRRFVLLDAGIRMWGVPRVFATAAGLALAAGSKPGIDVHVFRAEGAELAPVDMTTAAGLTEHLEALDHRAHPGAALPALAELLTEAGEDDDEADVVLVTGDDVLADWEFQRALAEARFGQIHLAAVGRDGRFQLQLQSPRGRKLLREAQFSLDDVLQPIAKPTVGLLAESKFELPAIFGAEPFPLLLSVQPDPTRTWRVVGVWGLGVLSYARDGRLLLWRDDPFGARQLAEGLPNGNLHWADPICRDGIVRAVIGKLSERGLYALSYDLKSGRSTTVRLESGVQQPRAVFARGGVVFVVSDHEVAAVSSASGQALAAARTGGMKHHRGRFFKTWNEGRWDWHAVSYNGREIVWELLFNWNSLLKGESRRCELLAVFDAVYKESAFGITSSGSLISFDSGAIQPLKLSTGFLNLFVAGASRDGSKVLLDFNDDKHRRQRVQVDVHVSAVSSARLSVEPLVELEMPEIRKFARPVALRRRFEGIGVSTGGVLLLIGRRQSIWLLRFDEREQSFRLSSKPALTNIAVSQRFAPIDSGDANRYSLAAATFADGSRAVLDARGLLHLKSSDPALPECTIVLVEGATSGWVSDGRCWGARYFIANRPATSAQAIYAEVIRPFTERLR
ncbi:MAG TPA: hypothetical protein VMV10_14890 [Pirellulales bacterium]|nr:hypothetical protein [Pirellulales bacterium]